MSENPLVCAIMLVNGRAAMVRRAVASFRAQTYRNKALVVWDTGKISTGATYEGPYLPNINVVRVTEGAAAKTIGGLRNQANEEAECMGCHIICHWDSDDWSHPQRIAEQVELLQASGADCVGYREALFWDTRPGQFAGAYLYRDPLPTHCLGASMCYWRRTWERRPFDHISHGEDARFQAGCKTHGVSALKIGDLDVEPRIIFGIHGDRQNGNYDLSKSYGVWKRSAAWDEHCAQVMQL